MKQIEIKWSVLLGRKPQNKQNFPFIGLSTDFSESCEHACALCWHRRNRSESYFLFRGCDWEALATVAPPDCTQATLCVMLGFAPCQLPQAEPSPAVWLVNKSGAGDAQAVP